MGFGVVKESHLHFTAHALEGSLELIHGDGPAAVSVDALEEAFQATDLIGRQGFGDGKQRSLLELVHGCKVAHAGDDHAVNGLVWQVLLLQPAAVQDLLGRGPP